MDERHVLTLSQHLTQPDLGTVTLPHTSFHGSRQPSGAHSTSRLSHGRWTGSALARALVALENPKARPKTASGHADF